MQKSLKLKGWIPLLLVIAIAITIRFFPESATETVSDAIATATIPDSEYYQLVLGSVYDGDTLRVTDGVKEIKIRFCGIDAPEKDQPLGIESRDHLRSLIDQGDGRLVVLPVEMDRYGRTVAEVFVPTSAGEIHLNSQMTADGMAYVYPQYVDGCPNAMAIVGGEELAKDSGLGVWADPNAVKPWDYRKRS